MLQLSGYMVNPISTRSLHLYKSVNPITKVTKLLYQFQTTAHSRNHLVKMDQDPWHPDLPNPTRSENDNGGGVSTLLLVFIPVLVVVLTVLVGMVVFLIVVLYVRRKRGIRLLEDGGPLDLSKGDGVVGEGGVEGVESRWLETVDPEVREAYNRAKDWQSQYPPTSIPTDITLSQFLSIQEKGVSAWAFEPDYEDNLSLYVQSRTEITFLADGPGMPAREGGGNNVMANLPLPKLNEVYYWEVKMYDKPVNTEVAIGLATKPYPSFRLPGWNKYSVAYFASDGFKSHNYPFTSASYGPALAEGDVLGVGYRPRTGTVFFTRNGRKLEDAYTGLQRLNLFPTVGANGPCTLHVNLGQAGFVFIEANVKKWGLAPMTGTLAPPPAYGSERGSILLESGYGTPGAAVAGGAGRPNRHSGMGALLEAARNRGTSGPGPQTQRTRRHKHRDHRVLPTDPHVSSPLRPMGSEADSSSAGATPSSPSPAPGFSSYVSPTDRPSSQTRVPPFVISSSSSSASGSVDEGDIVDGEDESATTPLDAELDREQSPIEHNPPTPNLLDISMHSIRGQYFPSQFTSPQDPPVSHSVPSPAPGPSRSNSEFPPPPGYAPLDPHVYANGLPADLPEDMVNQAIAAMSEA